MFTMIPATYLLHSMSPCGTCRCHSSGGRGEPDRIAFPSRTAGWRTCPCSLGGMDPAAPAH